MRTNNPVAVILVALIIGCAGTKDEHETQRQSDSSSDSWSQESVDESDSESPDQPSDDEEKPDEGDKPDEEDAEYKECDETFDPDEPCEGDYTTTMCLFDGLYWWCQDGVWLNEDDKP